MVLFGAAVLLWTVTEVAALQQVDLRALSSPPSPGNLSREAHLLKERILANATLSASYGEAYRPLTFPQEQVYPWIVARGAWIHKGVLQRPRKLPWELPSPKAPLEVATTAPPSTTEEPRHNATSGLPQQSAGEGPLSATVNPTELEATVATTAIGEQGSGEESDEVSHQQDVEQPASTAETYGTADMIQEPVVMPVTEGKNRGHDYGLPKELMPIHPGGGSKFDDLEKERLERAKMAQTKLDDDDLENGNSYDAEGLYSSAPAPLGSTPLLGFIVCARIAL